MKKQMLGKRYVSPEEAKLVSSEKERKRRIKLLKMQLASGLKGEEYKQAMKEYRNLLFGRFKTNQEVLKDDKK